MTVVHITSVLLDDPEKSLGLFLRLLSARASSFAGQKHERPEIQIPQTYEFRSHYESQGKTRLLWQLLTFVKKVAFQLAFYTLHLDACSVFLV